MVFLERSSFRGRWRAAGNSGDPGSFLTIILGGAPALRELFRGLLVSELIGRRDELGISDLGVIAYALGGDDFAVGGGPLGEPLPERCC